MFNGENRRADPTDRIKGKSAALKNVSSNLCRFDAVNRIVQEGQV